MSGPLQQARQAAGQWWRQLADRERSLVQVGGSALALLLLWQLGIAPAWRTLSSTPAQLESLEQQLQRMGKLANETQALRALPALPAAQAAPALQAAAERLGDRAKLSLQGDRGVLTLKGLSGAELRALLAEARSGARARAIEAQLTRGPQGYDGTLVLAIGSGN
jgi:general secretion pathway protein M